MRIARWALAILFVAPLAAPFVARPALAQDQDNSVAAAARRTQEQKKDQPKAAHVYDNDHMPTSGPVNVVGQQPAAGSTDDTTAAGNTAAQTVEEKPAPTATEVAGLNADLASAKQRLADLKADLDVAQRKYTLDQATYLSNPNHSMDRAGAAALDVEKSEIDAKAAAVADAEKAFAAAQAKLDEGNKAAAAAAAQEKAAQAQAKADTAQSSQTAPPQNNSAPGQPAPTLNSDGVPVNPN